MSKLLNDKVKYYNYNEAEDSFGNLEEHVTDAVKTNIDYLYNNVNNVSIEKATQIIQDTQYFLEQLDYDACSPFWIECKLLLLEIYEVLIIDEVDENLAIYIIKNEIVKLIDQVNDVCDIYNFEDTMLSASRIVPNMREYLCEINNIVYIDDVLKLIECNRLILHGDYNSAYYQSKRILEKLFQQEHDYLCEEKSYGKEEHKIWIKRKFDFCLKLATISDNIDDLNKFIGQIMKNDFESISDEDLKELKTKIDVEILCSNHIDKIRKSNKSNEDNFNVIRKYFKRVASEEKEKNTDYICNMINLNLRVLEKKIQEDYDIDGNEYNELNEDITNLCEKEIELLKNDYMKINLKKRLEEKRLNSNILLWKTNGEKPELIKKISGYQGENLLINSVKQLILLNKFNDYTEALYRLIDKFVTLYCNVIYLEKKLLVWNYNNDYTYYTTLHTFSYLLLDEKERINENSNRLSLMNSNYMNDPNEGNVLFDILVNENSKKVRKRYDDSLVFLKSFSKKIDKLTMWSEHGDKGKGCCVVINGNTFKETKKKILLLNNLGCETYDYEDDDYRLYNILYWNSKDNKYILNGTVDDIAVNLLTRITYSVTDICSIAEQISNSSDWINGIIDIIRKIVNKISYLIKYEEYQDEEESRLILIRNNYSNVSEDIEIINDDNEPLKSKLYVQYPLKTQMDEIIFGPKVVDADNYAPFILKKLNEINSDNNITTKLTMSSIDYR